jgi:enoyl-CoA hydratase/carnithine racemase
MTDGLRVERPDSVANVEIWTIDDPETRNAISSPEMIAALVDNVRRIDQDTSVRAVVLTGAGKAFSSGGNVRDMAEGKGMFGGSPFEQRNSYRHGIQQIPVAIHHSEVPFIAAVNGPAVGAGCDLAMMCDLRIASERAWFAESFVQLGIIPGDGGAWFLTQAIGPARAAEMALTGDRVDAAKALEWGMVSQVCAPDELLDRALELAARVAKNPSHAVRMAKQLLRASRTADLGRVLEMSAALQAIAHQEDEHRDRVRAWLDR